MYTRVLFSGRGPVSLISEPIDLKLHCVKIGCMGGAGLSRNAARGEVVAGCNSGNPGKSEAKIQIFMG